ncbi:MAG: type 4a pilus biogenesis protein PilO [Planctomycetes bacterium]|nr:type 4a pilus biogenesis protein PilO [Planctomycetota bacterium]
MKQRPLNKKFLFTAVGILCLISAAAASAAYPKINGIMKNRDELLKGKEQFELCKQAVVSVEDYNIHKPVIAMYLKRYEAGLPAGERVPELVAQVRAACRAAGVANVSIITRRAELMTKGRDPVAVCEDGAIHKLPVAVAGTGTYRGIALLLNSLATGRRLVVTRSLTIEQPEQGSKLVRFQAEAEAFCFLPTDEN